MQELLETAADYLGEAFDLGVDEAKDALDIDDLEDGVVDDLSSTLKARVEKNADFMRDSLMPDIKAGDYDEDFDALDDRLGDYANALYPTAQHALTSVASDEGVLMIWVLDPAAEHCDNCPTFADGGPYSDPDDPVDDSDPLPAFPGDGTDCYGNCRCELHFDQGTFDAYSAARGNDQV